MASAELDACIIPTDDVHQSEYVCARFRYREWLSGFTGSAGVLAVSRKRAGLWTDSRYYLQAEKELEGSGITLFRATEPDTLSMEDWLVREGCRAVGFDGEVFPAGRARQLKAALEARNCWVCPTFQSYDRVWKDRPALPSDPIWVYDEKYAGESFDSKLTRLRGRLAALGADTLPVSTLDDIAWLFNLRGSDVECNPVGLAFALIEPAKVTLFVSAKKLTSAAKRYLSERQVIIRPYRMFCSVLRRLPAKARVLTDTQRINYAVFKALSAKVVKVEALSPLTEMKAVKNPVEIEGFRKAVVQDGVTLLRLWKWMEETIGRGETLSEYAIAERLMNLRRADGNCFGESFAPIVSFNANGAIVHYEPSPEQSAPVTGNGILLIDSGGQYMEGTTDITRTYSFYEADATPDAYKKDYAAVLKGNIALAGCRFPEQTRGASLDVLARQFLWQQGAHYGHGTGHGIGHFLNVHEGPQSIRREENPVVLRPGMVISDEPGVYRTGAYGVRLENMILCEEKETTGFGTFQGFETLTLFPFDRKSIDSKYYTRAEIAWINRYHQRVYQALAPHLTAEEQAWLKEKTKTI